MASRARGEAVRRDAASAGGFPVCRPSRLPAPALRLEVGLRPFRPGAGRRHVFLARLEPRAGRSRGLDLDFAPAQAPRPERRAVFRRGGRAAELPHAEDAVWLWDHLPLLAYVEFPWRLLSVAALCFAMLAAALGPALDALGRWRRPALAAALALLIVPNLFHLAPPRVADVDLALWTPARLASSGYEST